MDNQQPTYETGYGEWISMTKQEPKTEKLPLVEALEKIRNTAFYHMISHADGREDRKVLGEIKEIAIKALGGRP